MSSTWMTVWLNALPNAYRAPGVEHQLKGDPLVVGEEQHHDRAAVGWLVAGELPKADARAEVNGPVEVGDAQTRVHHPHAADRTRGSAARGGSPHRRIR